MTDNNNDLLINGVSTVVSTSQDENYSSIPSSRNFIRLSQNFQAQLVSTNEYDSITNSTSVSVRSDWFNPDDIVESTDEKFNGRNFFVGMMTLKLPQCGSIVITGGVSGASIARMINEDDNVPLSGVGYNTIASKLKPGFEPTQFQGLEVDIEDGLFTRKHFKWYPEGKALWIELLQPHWTGLKKLDITRQNPMGDRQLIAACSSSEYSLFVYNSLKDGIITALPEAVNMETFLEFLKEEAAKFGIGRGVDAFGDKRQFDAECKEDCTNFDMVLTYVDRAKEKRHPSISPASERDQAHLELKAIVSLLVRCSNVVDGKILPKAFEICKLFVLLCLPCMNRSYSPHYIVVSFFTDTHSMQENKEYELTKVFTIGELTQANPQMCDGIGGVPCDHVAISEWGPKYWYEPCYYCIECQEK